jgi:hypothetical protein
MKQLLRLLALFDAALRLDFFVSESGGVEK